MIKISNLSYAYTKNTPIFSEINLEFDRRSTAIIGQNGAGKTTLAKLLKGLLKPFDGEIMIGQYNVKTVSAAELSKVIGLVFQNPNDQIFKSKVLDEVMFGPLAIKMSESAAKKNALEALELVGLHEQLETNPHDLSLSEKKLLCVAAVVAMDPEIIVFDEPTIGQDYAGKEKIRNIIQVLKKRNKLVMTIIHDMDFVAENFERTIVINEGIVILDGDTRKVFAEREILKHAHVEDPSITQLGKVLGFQETFLTVEEFVQRWKQSQR
ncbi:MAG: ABC transporter ATP-binding protein [Bacillota bacterium]|nr:ABC transporter ATP-binding protein [Bacillota bacterium]MDP4169860.1 ABC transporter ATP-binding protein [Bacillota bacterium]